MAGCSRQGEIEMPGHSRLWLRPAPLLRGCWVLWSWRAADRGTINLRLLRWRGRRIRGGRGSKRTELRVRGHVERVRHGDYVWRLSRSVVAVVVVVVVVVVVGWVGHTNRKRREISVQREVLIRRDSRSQHGRVQRAGLADGDRGVVGGRRAKSESGG